jgi:ComF family protein
MISSILNKAILLLDLLLGQSCIVCKKGGTLLCDSCAFKLERSDNIKDVLVCFSYRDRLVRKAIHYLKFRGAFSIARPLSLVLYEKLVDELLEDAVLEGDQNVEPFLIIPIPLSKKRLAKRGYNQVEVLAKELVKYDQNGFELGLNILQKTKETKSQVSLGGRIERLKNLEGAFTVMDPQKILSRNIILLDDVLTTGATMNEATKTLMSFGAKKIRRVALAH